MCGAGGAVGRGRRGARRVRAAGLGTSPRAPAADGCSASSTTSSSPSLPRRPVRRRGPRRARSSSASRPRIRRRAQLIAALREQLPALRPAARRRLRRRPALRRLRRRAGPRAVSGARRDPQVSRRALLRRPRISRDPRRTRASCCATPDGRGGDPLEPFYFLDGIDVGNFDGFLERCFGDGTWQNTFGVGAGTRSFVTSIGCPHRCIFCTSNPGWRRTGTQALPADPAAPPEALGVPAAHRVRRAQADRAGRDGERPDGLRSDAPHAERARLHLRFPERHARGPSEPRGDRRSCRDASAMLSISAESATQERSERARSARDSRSTRSIASRRGVASSACR